MPLNLLSSRLRHSLGSEKKANGCWKLLLLGVPHLERYPAFQWALLLVPMCSLGILFLFFYLSLVTSISGSVLNSLYPFNDSFLQYPLFMTRESLWTISSCSVDRRTALSPKASKDCHEYFPSLCLNVSGLHPLSLWEGICGQYPHLYSGKLDFVTFFLSQSRTEVFSWKNLAGRTLLEFLILRNLCRNTEHRCLEYGGHSQGFGLCHCILGH